MSKIANNLQSALEARNSKYQEAMQNEQTETLNKKQNQMAPLDKQSLLVIVGCVVLMGLLSLTLSFKAFAQIQEKNSSLIKLASIIIKHNEKIEQLTSTIENFDSYQSGQFNDLKKNIASIDKVVNRSERAVSALAVDSSLIQVVVDDLKKTNKELTKRYDDLSDEIKILKSLKAIKMMQ